MKMITLKKVVIVSVLLGCLLILVVLLSITMGSVKVPPLRSIRILLESILGSKETGSETERAIILSLRVPRIILAGLVGAGLSVVGIADHHFIDTTKVCKTEQGLVVPRNKQVLYHVL